jgi:hypothetical protein
MNAVHNGGALPLIGEILVCSESWGIPPWAVYGGDDSPQSRWKWFRRWQYKAGLESQRRMNEANHGGQ